jgi:sulfite exporter TauE/SafE
MINLYLIFLLGLLGSLHCISMCGPLVFLMGFKGKSGNALKNALIYHGARILVYSLMGAIVGGLMYSLNWYGFTQIASWVMGSIFLLVGLAFVLKIKFLLQPVIQFSSKWTSLFNQKSTWKKYLLAGTLNGLLPCGLVYVALSSSTLTHNYTEGALTMFVFGLGTLPSLLFGSVCSNWVKNKISFIKNTWLISFSYVLIGLLLILRGSNLGIPYLSPKQNPHNHEIKCCKP